MIHRGERRREQQSQVCNGRGACSVSRTRVTRRAAPPMVAQGKTHVPPERVELHLVRSRRSCSSARTSVVTVTRPIRSATAWPGLAGQVGFCCVWTGSRKRRQAPFQRAPGHGARYVVTVQVLMNLLTASDSPCHHTVHTHLWVRVRAMVWSRPKCQPRASRATVQLRHGPTVSTVLQSAPAIGMHKQSPRRLWR
jgi:hypothetical protein